MDLPPRPLGPSLPSPPVRLRDPGDVAGALPHLLGFHPAESVVLVALGGAGGERVGLTVRADLPPPGTAAAAARALVRSLRTDEPHSAVLVIVSEDADVPDRSCGAADDEEERSWPGEAGVRWLPGGPPVLPDRDLPHRDLVHAVVLELAAAALPVAPVLLVRRGRWWSYDCPHPCCAPDAGTPVPSGATELAAAGVLAGVVVEQNREALAARLAPPPEAGADMATSCVRAARELAARLRERGTERVAEESWTAILSAVSRLARRSAQAGLADAEVARIVCGLRDREVRDRALQLAAGPLEAVAEVLWTECARRAPAPLDAAPATLLAVSAWLRGDGAMANVALERALDSDPDCTLARLLSQALAACLPPAELRALLAGAETADARGRAR